MTAEQLCVIPDCPNVRLEISDYCAQHFEEFRPEQRAVDPEVGVRCMSTWLRSNGFRVQADDAEFYAKQVTKLKDDIASICLHRDTPPLTRSRLRHAMAGVDWRKAK